MRRWDPAVQLLGPIVLVVGTALLGTLMSLAIQTYFINALVYVTIVVALYLFIGNSGVLSFGHISFVAVGAWTAGVLSVPAQAKPAIMPGLAHFLRASTVGNVPSLAIAAGVGGVYALAVGLPLMRLSGLTAGIATFAVLEITHNVLRNWEKIGPGLNAFSSVPATTGLLQAASVAVLAVIVAFAYQRIRFGSLLRAARDDVAAARAVGISVYHQRLIAFALSGALAGLAGGVYIHYTVLGSEDFYLDLTFLTLAMLVVGGTTSLLGAVVGALAVSGVDFFLQAAVNVIHIAGFRLKLPDGTPLVVVGAFMALVLVARPSGLTGGRELRLPERWRRGRTAPSDKVPA